MAIRMHKIYILLSKTQFITITYKLYTFTTPTSPPTIFRCLTIMKCNKMQHSMYIAELSWVRWLLKANISNIKLFIVLVLVVVFFKHFLWCFFISFCNPFSPFLHHDPFLCNFISWEKFPKLFAAVTMVTVPVRLGYTVTDCYCTNYVYDSTKAVFNIHN